MKRRAERRGEHKAGIRHLMNPTCRLALSVEISIGTLESSQVPTGVICNKTKVIGKIPYSSFSSRVEAAGPFLSLGDGGIGICVCNVPSKNNLLEVGLKKLLKS